MALLKTEVNTQLTLNSAEGWTISQNGPFPHNYPIIVIHYASINKSSMES